MNEVFKQHTTNTAFLLSMSKRQIDVLLSMDKTTAGNRPLYEYSHVVPTVRKLQEKGLVESYGKLTKAGRLTCLLLTEAGFQTEFKAHDVTEKAA